MNKLFRYFFVITLGLTLISWGGTGHYIISNNATLSFNQEMQQLQAWGYYLAEHASDADNRKSYDSNEAPKHYIDIDNYSEFNSYGYIPQTLNEAIAVHGSYYVYDWGILPYATKTTYDSLRNNMAKQNWDRAKYFAADLGHYVADGHMPLHITKNYNGQYTGNDGIHSRYENTMINAHSANLTYSGDAVEQIGNVTQYILNYLYANYKYVDSVIITDDYAKSVNSNYSSTEYKDALWAKAGDFTVMLFKNASHALAELIYSAWKEAGSPSLTGVSLIDTQGNGIWLAPIYPNPVRKEAAIAFHLNTPTYITISIHSINGTPVAMLANGNFTQGDYSVSWTPNNQPNGIYIVTLSAPSKKHLTKKLILSR
ncbi:MAG: T9SS type A sorting domain-containing protein [Bacteroidales bacterium]